MARRQPPSWLGRIPTGDVVLAAALCVFAVGGLVTGQVDEHPLAVTLPIAVVSTVLVAARRRFPVGTATVISVLAVAQALCAGHSSNTLWALVVFLVAAYTVAAECDESRALAGLGIVLGSQFLCEWIDRGTDYPFDTLVFGGVWLFGRGTRFWRTRADYAERHRHDLARIAVAEERTRIARELHDVVAHSLSVIAVQADAAEAALLKDPGRAGPPMRAIRDSARNALGDMRQLLHVLRTQDDQPVGGADLNPARGLADLPRLVDTLREAGLPVTAVIEPGSDLSSGTELAVFRIVQEALTNVRKHAGSVPTRLRITRLADELTVEVANDPPRPGTGGRGDPMSTGHGLIGVRERVQATGGTLRAGPRPDGGYLLVAQLLVGSRQGQRA